MDTLGSTAASLFDLVWRRIELHQGQIFHTKSGKEFRYLCSGGTVKPLGAPRPIPRKDFERVFAMGALSSPRAIAEKVESPSHLWAILNDRRIVP